MKTSVAIYHYMIGSVILFNVEPTKEYSCRELQMYYNYCVTVHNSNACIVHKINVSV